MKIKENNFNKETARIALMAAILAIFFGISQSIPQETFDTINMPFALKLLSTNFFAILLWLYLFYFLILSLSYGYKNSIKPKIVKILFDLIITLTIITAFLTFIMVVVIKLVILFPQYIQPGWKTNLIIYCAIILSAAFFVINLFPHFKHFNPHPFHH